MGRLSHKNIIVICTILVTLLLTAGLSIHFETFLPKFRSSDTKDEPFHGRKHLSHMWTNESWCEVNNNYSDQFLAPMRTNWKDWSFKKTVKCPTLDLNSYPKPRRKVSLDCSGPKPKLTVSLTNDTRDIFSVDSTDTKSTKCLEDFIDHCCSDEKPVPNVVHHVMFGGKEFGYFPFLSFMSASRFMRPCVHLIHGDYVPSGKYWDYFISISPNVIHVKTIPPTEVFGQKLVYPEHRADVLRIDAINRYGGVYTDWDMVLLNYLEPLRKYETTMSELLEKGYLGIAFIMTRKNATFVNKWKDGYKTYLKAWGHNSQKVPYLLSQKYPDTIHVEGHNFFKPGMQTIFNKNYDFRTNYGMHLAIRYYKKAIDPKKIRNLDVLMGAVGRHILLGDKERCLN